jgi:hypothetical protein
MVDGHGYSHPRRFGFASHLGLLLDLPTIGIAKSRLIGEAGTVAGPRGARADIVDRGEVIGSMLRTRQGVRSVYVSVGHRISLVSAERWALACARHRLPEPTRLADRLAGDAKRRMIEATLPMVVEQRAGERGRWEWVPEDDEVVLRNDLAPPMPLHYGCVPRVVNPADGELLDVMLYDNQERQRGERLDVRVVDVLERADGDHKLLAVPAGATPGVPVSARDRVWRWCIELEKPVTQWGGEDRALALIRECRMAAELAHA